LETLHAIRAEGFTFGGVLTRQSSGGNTAPDGYDMSIDGYLEAQKIEAPDNGCTFSCLRPRGSPPRLPAPPPRATSAPKTASSRSKATSLPCTEGGELDRRRGRGAGCASATTRKRSRRNAASAPSS
jgi:hypothetical protein